MILKGGTMRVPTRFLRAVVSTLALTGTLVATGATPASAACADAAAPNVDWSGCDVSDLDLAGYDLAGADFTDANVAGSNFSGTNLEGANFTGASVSNVSFVSARLAGADFSDANIVGANFVKADLTDVAFDATADVTGTKFVNPPLGAPEEGTTDENFPIAFSILGNDVAHNEGPATDFTVELVTEPANGTVSLDPETNIYTYTPDNGYSGEDSFQYKPVVNLSWTNLPANAVSQGDAGVPITVDITINPCLNPLSSPYTGTSGIIGSVSRLYGAYFNRNPDLAGFTHWTSAINSGTASLGQASDLFAQSSEFNDTYGDVSNDEFLALVYKNVLCRPGDNAGLEYWSAQMDAGLSRGDVMLSFSETAEYKEFTRTQ